MVNDKPNITLLRLVLSNPSKFYKQDWYYDEEFANTPLAVGDHYIDSAKIGRLEYPPAVVLAWMYVYDEFALSDYLWTSDFDKYCNRVYVGGLGLDRGFQIHRHLAHPEVDGIGYVFGSSNQ